jgi:tetratricopeptide (TPR) repeat protein
MEQSAEPGTVQISEQTHKLVAPMFEYESLGGIEVKGKAEPVNAFRVLATRAQPGQMRGIEGMRSPIIGRAPEVAQLRAAVEDLRQGQGQLIALMGEAGLGKSRLAAEMREEALAEAGVDWFEGRSVSYQTQTPYAPFVSLFNTLLDIPRGVDDSERYAAVVSGLRALNPVAGEGLAPYVGSLLGVDLPQEASTVVRFLEPPELRDRVFNTVSQLVSEMALKKPTVLVFEDLHWADPTSVDLVESLMPLTDTTMLMLMAAFRPNRQDPSWKFHEVGERDYQHRFTGIELKPLDPEQTEAMCTNLLQVAGIPSSIHSLILSKSEGNPFFVEEIIRALLDTGAIVRDGAQLLASRAIDDVAVPDTLAGVLTTRLDQLEDSAKRAVQTAAVIGREFNFDLLSAIDPENAGLESALTSLKRGGLVRETSRVPRRVFMFKHALTQDTAYGSLLLSRRRELHREIADWMEREEPERVNEIGRHLLEARENERALPYLVVGGNEASKTFSMREATVSYRRAVSIVDAVDDVALGREAFEGLGGALQFTGDGQGALETYQKMEDFAARHGDGPMRVSALNKQAFVKGMMMGDIDAAEAKLEESEQLAQEVECAPGLAELNMTYCYIRTSNGDLDDAYDRLQTAASIGRELDLVEPKLFGMVHVANTLNLMTRFDEAKVAADEALELALEAGHLGWEAELLGYTLPLYYLSRGNLVEAVETAEKGTNLALQIGSLGRAATGLLIQAMIARMTGDYDRALSLNQRAMQKAQESGLLYIESAALCEIGATFVDISPRISTQAVEPHRRALQILDMPMGNAFASMVLAQVGFCAIAEGNFDDASALLRRGLGAASGTRLFATPQLNLGLGIISLIRGDTEQSFDFIEKADSYAREHEMFFFQPFTGMVKGMFFGATGQPEQAMECYRSAEEQSLAMGMRPVLWQVRAGMAGLMAADGKPEEAGEMRESARQVVELIASGISDAELRGQFVGNATGKL